MNVRAKKLIKVNNIKEYMAAKVLFLFLIFSSILPIIKNPIIVQITAFSVNDSKPFTSIEPLNSYIQNISVVKI